MLDFQYKILMCATFGFEKVIYLRGKKRRPWTSKTAREPRRQRAISERELAHRCNVSRTIPETPVTHRRVEAGGRRAPLEPTAAGEGGGHWDRPGQRPHEPRLLYATTTQPTVNGRRRTRPYRRELPPPGAVARPHTKKNRNPGG